MTGIEGEAKRVIGFGVGEFYTFVHRTPVGQVSIQIPRVMVAGAPGMQDKTSAGVISSSSALCFHYPHRNRRCLPL